MKARAPEEHISLPNWLGLFFNLFLFSAKAQINDVDSLSVKNGNFLNKNYFTDLCKTESKGILKFTYNHCDSTDIEYKDALSVIDSLSKLADIIFINECHNIPNSELQIIQHEFKAIRKYIRK